jgi:hypothetical protein
LFITVLRWNSLLNPPGMEKCSRLRWNPMPNPLRMLRGNILRGKKGLKPARASLWQYSVREFGPKPAQNGKM